MIDWTAFTVSIPVLIYCWNIACASLIACGISLALSRRQKWSLPLRHGLLVAAIAVSAVIPFVHHLVALLSLGTFSLADPAARPTSVLQQAIAAQNDPIDRTPLDVAASSIFDDTNEIPVTIAERESTNKAVPGFNPNVLTPELASTTRPWSCIVGNFLCGLWLAGIAVSVGRGLEGVLKRRRWMQRLTMVKSPQLMSLVKDSAARMRLRAKVAIYLSNVMPAPVTYGLWRPKIVFPCDIESQLSTAQLQAVIRHELAHIQRCDLWIGLLQSGVQALYWWNPLINMVNEELADLREQICDDIAIRDLPDPREYAVTLIEIAERCSGNSPVPATLGFGVSPARQLEDRISRIIACDGPRPIQLSHVAHVGLASCVVLMLGTIALAQIKVETPDRSQPPAIQPQAAKPEPGANQTAEEKPTLSDLIQRMAGYERKSMPFDMQVMETFQFPDDLSPQERARNLRADGRKHQRLMGYAQLARGVWWTKETVLIDDEVTQGPYERFSDGERIIQVSPGSTIINGKQTLEYYINNRKNDIGNYLNAEPLTGIFCLATYSASELFSEAFEDEEGIELAWQQDNARLTFKYGQPHFNMKFVLWLSRAHAWHPIRWQRYWDANDELFYDEWEVTQFARQGNVWRVVEGIHRYRAMKGGKVVEPRIISSISFKVLEDRYGGAVDDEKFKCDIPAGAKVHDDRKPVADPQPAKMRNVTIRVVDPADRPIENATVRVVASPLRDFDRISTDENGVARSGKAPAGNAAIQVSAEGFRPISWIMADSASELRAIMVPQSTGMIVDEQEKPIAEAYVTNEQIQFRADGIAIVSQRDWDGRDKDWSNADGRFELTSGLTLQRLKTVVPLIAIDPNRELMAIRFIADAEMGQPQKLVVQPVCHVHGYCELKGTGESVVIGQELLTSDGELIGFLPSARREQIAGGLRVDVKVRVPPGEYRLRCRATSQHVGYEIPFTVKRGQKDLDLGTRTIEPAGTVALKGKPAPALNVKWRSGEQSDWETLRGKVVVLDFWGTWCVPCITDMPDLMAIQNRFKDKPVAWISVHTPEPKSFEVLDEKLAKIQENDWDKRPLPFTLVIDQPASESDDTGDTSRRYGVTQWPTLIVIDQQGNVVGAVSKQKLAETISLLLKSTN